MSRAETLENLYVDPLKDIYNAEKQLTLDEEKRADGTLSSIAQALSFGPRRSL